MREAIAQERFDEFQKISLHDTERINQNYLNTILKIKIA